MTLVLDDCGQRKILAIKEIRTVTGLGLREAKDIADGVATHLPWSDLVFAEGPSAAGVNAEEFFAALVPALLD